MTRAAEPPKPRRNRHLRDLVFERDQGICARCGRYDPKWEADHIVAIWSGGPDRIEVMQTLCRHCHKQKTKAEAPVRAKTDRLRARHAATIQRRQITKRRKRAR